MEFALKMMTVACLIGSSTSFAQPLTYDPTLNLTVFEYASVLTTLNATSGVDHVLTRFPSVAAVPFTDAGGFAAAHPRVAVELCKSIPGSESAASGTTAQDYALELDSSTMSLQFSGNSLSAFDGATLGCAGPFPDENVDADGSIHVEIPFVLQLATNMDVTIDLFNIAFATPGGNPAFVPAPYVVADWSLFLDVNANGVIDATDVLAGSDSLWLSVSASRAITTNLTGLQDGPYVLELNAGADATHDPGAPLGSVATSWLTSGESAGVVNFDVVAF